MTVKELKEFFKEQIEKLDRFDDETKVPTSSNTYGMVGNFLALEDGFIGIDDLESELEESENECDGWED